MSKETHPKKLAPTPGLFINLISVETLIAGILTAVFAAQISVKVAVLASIIAIMGGMGLFIPGQIDKQRSFLQKIISGVQHPVAKFIPLATILILGFLLFFLDLSISLFWVISPLIFCVWLIGVEFLLFFPSRSSDFESSQIDKQHQRWVILGLILALGVAMIPTRLPSLLNGIPLDTPFEFTLVVFLLPFAFIIEGRFFSKKSVLVILGILLIIKVAALIFLPQAGLGFRAYSSEEALANGNWEKSYGTFFSPSYTQVTQTSYNSYPELPIEWINHNEFSRDEFWVALELSGFLHLQKDERLVLVVEGAKQADVNMVDAGSRQTIPVVVVKNIEEIDSGLYQEIPEMRASQLQGTLVFATFGQYRIEPLIIYPDGSTKSALALSRIWISQNHVNASFPQALLDLAGLTLGLLLMTGLVLGLVDLYRSNKISAVDVYLGATALLVFYIAFLIPRPEMNFALISIVSILALVKFLDHSMSPHELSGMEFFVSICPALLLIFLALDINNLRDVTIFPQGQDGLEYQILARNIYLNHDVFLTQTPPRAYKVLYPYLVGSLHILFGQSASAQLFLNACCALLSSVFIVKLSNAFRLSAQTSLTASVTFLLILFLPASYIFYFRFGLIEPVAIMLLLATYYFAMSRNIPAMFIAGVLTSLFRLDYLGGILAAMILTSDPIIGMAGVAWMQFLEWLRAHWKLVAIYSFSVIVPSLLIILGYYMFVPNYKLTASINNQTSPGSILESLLIVILGGDLVGLKEKFSEKAMDVLLITIPVALGFLLAFTSLLYRKGLFQKIDLRLILLILGILPAYFAVRPTGYFPRYSWAPLPLALILIGYFCIIIFSKQEQSSSRHFYQEITE